MDDPLVHGEPLVFGPDGASCVVQDGFGGLRIAETNQVDAAEIVVHDAHRESPAYAFALSRLSSQDLRYTPMGVFRSVEKPTYDRMMAEQLDVGEGRARTDLDAAVLLVGTPTPLDGQRLVPAGDRPQDGAGIGRRLVADPGHELVGPHEDQPDAVSGPAVGEGVADDGERHARAGRGLLERGHAGGVGVPGQEREAPAELLEDVASRGQLLRRQVVPRPVR